MNDVTSKVVGVLLEAQTLLATVNGPAAPTAGMEGLISVIARVGTPGNATGILSLQVQTSADGSTGWVNLGSVLGGFTTAGGNALGNIDPARSLGFLRVVATATGTTPTFPLIVLYIGTQDAKTATTTLIPDGATFDSTGDTAVEEHR